MKKWMTVRKALCLALLIPFCVIFMGAADDAYYQQKLLELKEKAQADHLRFLELPDGKFDAAIAEDLLKNDGRVLEETPTGSIKVTVKDADTNQPIQDAMVLLTATIQRYTVSNGVSTQTANAFIVINMGKSPKDGTLLYTTPLFFHDDIRNDDGSMPQNDLSYVSVSVGEVDVSTARVKVLPIAQSSYQPDDIAAVLPLLTEGEEYGYAELENKLKGIAGLADPNATLYTLFNYRYVDYTDETIVLLSRSDPKNDAFKELNDKGGKPTYGALKAYIKANPELMMNKVVKRYYRDLGGYTPNYTCEGTPQRIKIIKYKDGTTETDVDEARIYLDLFEGVIADKGIAYDSDGFNYAAYAYHPDYESGGTKGTYIRQYLNDADKEIVILLSKTGSPIALDTSVTMIYGRLLGSTGQPMSGARITCIETDAQCTTDVDGYYSMRFNQPGEYTFAVYKPDSATELVVSGILDGEKPTAALTITVTDTPASHQINFFEEGYVFAEADVKPAAKTVAKTSVNIILILAAALALVVIGGVVLLILSRKKKAAVQFPMQQPVSSYAQPLEQPANIPTIGAVCNQCGAPILAGSAFCNNCGAKICAHCSTANTRTSSFCCNCGNRMGS